MAMRREMRKGDDDPSTTYHNSERISDPTDSQLTCSVTCITFSPSGSLVAGGLEDASVRVWERDNTAQAEILGYHIRDTVQAITFSPDGAFVLSGSLDRTAFIWAVGQPSAGPVAELVGHQEAVTAAAWSPDGLHIVTGSEDGSMRLWDAKTQEQIAEWGSLIVPILSLAFSPDGRRVASGSAGHLLRIWDRDSGQTISSSMHTAAVNAVSFSPDGSRVLCGSQDGSVWIWGNSGSLLSLKLKSHQGRVLGVGFSADSSRVASGASDGTLNIWSPSINEINAIHERSADVTCLAFSPHGLHAARGHSDGTIIIDELPEMSPGIPPDEASPPEVVHPAEVPEVSLEAAHNDGQGSAQGMLTSSLPNAATTDLGAFMRPRGRKAIDLSQDGPLGRCRSPLISGHFLPSLVTGFINRKQCYLLHGSGCYDAGSDDNETLQSQGCREQTESCSTDPSISPTPRESDAVSCENTARTSSEASNKESSATNVAVQVAYGRATTRTAHVPLPTEDQRTGTRWCCC